MDRILISRIASAAALVFDGRSWIEDLCVWWTNRWKHSRYFHKDQSSWSVGKTWVRWVAVSICETLPLNLQEWRYSKNDLSTWTSTSSTWNTVKWFYAIPSILDRLSFNRWSFSTMKAKVRLDHSTSMFLYHLSLIDVSLLKQFSQPTENKGYVKECIQREMAFMRQAFKCEEAASRNTDRYWLSTMIALDPWGKAIVYATFSKNKSENDDVVQALIDEQTEQRSQSIQRKEAGIYKYDLAWSETTYQYLLSEYHHLCFWFNSVHGMSKCLSFVKERSFNSNRHRRWTVSSWHCYCVR